MHICVCNDDRLVILVLCTSILENDTQKYEKRQMIDMKEYDHDKERAIFPKKSPLIVHSPPTKNLILLLFQGYYVQCVLVMYVYVFHARAGC